MRRSVCAITLVEHITHLGEISPPDWQTIPYKRVGKTAGSKYFNLAFRGLTFAPPDCTSWLLEMEEDGSLNIFSSYKSLLPMLTGI